MTREEAVKTLKGEAWICCAEKWNEALDMAIKALERDTVLDKIRAEIEQAVWEDVVVSLDGTDEVRIPRLDPNDVFKIINKYRK
jgi:hypothetical protein